MPTTLERLCDQLHPSHRQRHRRRHRNPVDDARTHAAERASARLPDTGSYALGCIGGLARADCIRVRRRVRGRWGRRPPTDSSRPSATGQQAGSARKVRHRVGHLGHTRHTVPDHAADNLCERGDDDAGRRDLAGGLRRDARNRRARRGARDPVGLWRARPPGSVCAERPARDAVRGVAVGWRGRDARLAGHGATGDPDRARVRGGRGVVFGVVVGSGVWAGADADGPRQRV